MKVSYDNIKASFLKLQDGDYKAFHARLIPNITPERIIGVRIPVLKQLAKEIYGTDEAKVFLNTLPHFYYEENNLHAFLIEKIKDFDQCIKELDRFLPFVDNWATCDSLRPKCFKKNPEKLLLKIDEWLCTPHTYTVRFAIEMLMVYFLDGLFSPEFPEKIAKIRSDEYYVNMMIAWYFATALAKQYNYILPFITEKKLEKWVHNKTIQKAAESLRLTKAQKDFLKKYRIK